MQIKDQQKTFRVLANSRILFDSMGSKTKKIFLDSLNKNSLKNVILSSNFFINSIVDENQYEEYFIFRMDPKIFFVNKKYIPIFLENIKSSIINDMKTEGKFKLN